MLPGVPLGVVDGVPPMPENRLLPVPLPSPALKVLKTPRPPPLTPPVPWLARPLPVPELLPPSTPGFMPSRVRTDSSVGVPGRGMPLPVASPVSWVRSGGQGPDWVLLPSPVRPVISGR